MKRFIWLIPAIFFSLMCTKAQAQDIPAWDLFGGYSYLRANVSHSSPGFSFPLNGGTTSVTENLNDWFGGRVEAGFFSGSESGKNVTAQTLTYGPVFSWRRYQKITPFAHAQFGTIHASQGYLGISQSAFKFAMIPGVGLDFQLNERVAIRLQADYMISRFLNLTQNNIEGSAGLVIHFGSK